MNMVTRRPCRLVATSRLTVNRPRVSSPVRQIWCLVIIFLLSPVTLLEAAWTTIKDCELVRGQYGDGDSFHVHSGSREMIVRMYFVDTPETDERFPDRLKEQADYFGVTVPEVLKLGEKAAEFCRKTLATRFTVVTQKQDARGASHEPRYYGFVLLDDGRTNYAELLVQNGLARVFGVGASRPDGPDTNEEWERLKRLEAKAKAQKVGGWGGKTAAIDRPKGEVTMSNDAFFNRAVTPTPVPAKPAVVVRPALQVPSRSATPPPALPPPIPTPEGTVDLNRASVEELTALPKVSRAMAQRIVAKRPFASPADLWNVEGMTEAIYAAMTPLVTVKN